MKKQAQITFILLISIFIVIIAALIFYVANYYKNKNLIEPLVFEKSSIQNYIDSCVKKTAEEGLILLGKQGSLVLDDSLKVKDIEIYYYFKNGNRVPSIENLQGQLSNYVKNNINVCLRGFEDFKKQGWDVEQGSFDAKTQINEKDVNFDVDFPLKISDKGSTINFEKFASKLNVRLKYIYDLANKVVDFSSKYKRQVDLSALNGYDVNVTVIDYEDSLIYNIADSNSMIMSRPYVFRFVVK